MSRFKDFFQNTLKSLNPFSYSELSSRIKKQAIIHFIIIISISCIIYSGSFIPSLFNISKTIDDNFEKIDSLNFQINIETNNPIELKINNPINIIESDLINSHENIIIDTTQNKPKYNSSSLFVNKQGIYYNNGNNIKEFSEILDLKSNQNSTKKLLVKICFLLIPGILLYSTIKMSLIILILLVLLSTITKLLLSISKNSKTIKYFEILNISLFASTIIGIGIITKIFIKNSMLYTALLFFGYFLTGIIQLLLSNKKNKKKSKKEQ
jgi:hypothetical protein